MGRSRGFTLVLALVVLALTSVLALGAAQGSIFGLRMADGGLARLALFNAAENGLEQRLARGVPSAAGAAAEEATVPGGTRVRVGIDREAAAFPASPPLGGYGIGFNAGTFVAEHYVARSIAVAPRGARSVLEQQFHLVMPGAR